MWGDMGLTGLTLLLSCPRQVHNVAFAFELMLDGGLKKPKARPEGNKPPPQPPAPAAPSIREGQQGIRAPGSLHVQWIGGRHLSVACVAIQPAAPGVRPLQSMLFLFADVVNLDLKSTLRVLYTLFTKYKDVE